MSDQKTAKMNGAYVKLYCKKKKIKPYGTAPIYFALRLVKEKLPSADTSKDKPFKKGTG